MDAVILAAGLGTRLRPYTLTTPKPLLPVQGRPLLDWTLAALPPQVERLIVVVHYLAEQVETYLRQQTHQRHWQTVFQDQPQGTGDALRRCQTCVRSDRFLVLNGDDLYAAADLEALAACAAGLLCHKVTEPRKFGIAFRKEDGTLERLVEKPDLEGPQLANTGAYLFPRSVFQFHIERSPRGEYEITDYVSLLAQRQPVQIVEASFWLPIGTEQAWRQAESLDLQTLLCRRPRG